MLLRMVHPAGVVVGNTELRRILSRWSVEEAFPGKGAIWRKGAGETGWLLGLNRLFQFVGATMHMVLLGLKKNKGDLEAKFNELE